MATNTTVVGPGETNTTLNAWFTAKAGDLVTAGNIEVADCKNFSDTTKVTISGWTTDASNFYRVQAQDDHGGIFSTSVFRLTAASTKDMLKSAADTNSFSEFIGLQIEVTGTVGGEIVKFSEVTGTILFERCLWYNTAEDDNSKVITGALLGKNTGATWNIFNCAFFGFDTTNLVSIGFASKSAGANIFNCTTSGCAKGFDAQGNSPLIKNCIGNNGNVSGVDYTGTWNSSSNFNLSEDTTAPGTGDEIVSTAVTFIGEASTPPDLHLNASEDGSYNGEDLSGTFTLDVDKQTRSDFDMGFDELIAAGGANPKGPFGMPLHGPLGGPV